MKKPKLTTILFTVAMALFPLSAFAADNITLKGSDTMVILGQRWAEEYMKKIGAPNVQVTGGGSGGGIASLIEGTTDICQSSRKMNPAEREKLRDTANTIGVEIPVARDGLAIYVNMDNPLTEISLPQLKLIFTGKVTNWKDVGGPDARITAYTRENTSGSYAFFKETALNGAAYGPGARSMPGTASVVNAVAKDKAGIGYGGAAYARGVRVLNVKKDSATPAVSPSLSAVQDNSYPLSRPLFFYLRNKPSGDIRGFINWVLSSEGQGIVSQVGYFPIN